MRLAVLAVVLAACTHHRPLRDAYEVRGDVTVQTYDGRLLEVAAVETPTGTVFRSHAGEVIELGSVVRVTDKRTLRGAAEGLGIGAGVGALGGIVLGFADGDDPPCQDGSWCLFNMSAPEKAVLGGILLGGLGGFIGLAAGAIMGSQFEYGGGDAPVITPLGPPGSVGGMTVRF